MKNKGEILNRVSKLVEGRNSVHYRQLIMNQRQERLRSLTLKYGVEVVALAAGYTVGTLQQYLRVKNPTTIGEESVAQAEHILKQL